MNFIEAANAVEKGSKVYYTDPDDGNKVFLKMVTECVFGKHYGMHRFELYSEELKNYPLDLYSINIACWKTLEDIKPAIKKGVEFIKACEAAINDKIVYRLLPGGMNLHLQHVGWDSAHKKPPHFTTFFNNKKDNLGIGYSDINNTWIVLEKS